MRWLCGFLCTFVAFAHSIETPFTAYKDGHASASSWFGNARTLLLISGETKAWVNHALADGVAEGLSNGRLSLFVSDLRSAGRLDVYLAKSLGYLENQTKLSYLEEASDSAIGQLELGLGDIESMVSVHLDSTFIEAVKNGLYDGLILVPTAGLEAELGAVESSRGALLFLDYTVSGSGTGNAPSPEQVAEQMKADSAFINSVRSSDAVDAAEIAAALKSDSLFLAAVKGAPGTAESLDAMPGKISGGQIADGAVGISKLATGTLDFASDGSRNVFVDSAMTAGYAATAGALSGASVSLSDPNFTTRATFDFLDASRLMATDGSNGASSVSSLSNWISGTTNRVRVADDGDGTVTLSGPQDLHTLAKPTFGGITSKDPSGGTHLTLSRGTGLTTITQSNNVHDLSINTNGQLALYVDASRRVGIGTNIPQSELDVEGTLTIESIVQDGEYVDPSWVVVKGAMEWVNNTTTPQPDDHLFFRADANETYVFEIMLYVSLYDVYPVNRDLKFNIQGPDSAEYIIYHGESMSRNEGHNSAGPANNFGENLVMKFFDGDPGMVKINGTLKNGPNAGYIRLHWSLGHDGGTGDGVEVHKGSYMRITKQ